jgi:hypothetical protein
MPVPLSSHRRQRTHLDRTRSPPTCRAGTGRDRRNTTNVNTSSLPRFTANPKINRSPGRPELRWRVEAPGPRERFSFLLPRFTSSNGVIHDRSSSARYDQECLSTHSLPARTAYRSASSLDEHGCHGRPAASGVSDSLGRLTRTSGRHLPEQMRYERTSRRQPR